MKKHRARQTEFYLECTHHLQNHNRSWTSYHGKRFSFFPLGLLHPVAAEGGVACISLLFNSYSLFCYLDADEFISINADVVTNAQELFRQPGSILRLVKKFSEPINGTNNPTPKKKVGSRGNTETAATEPEYWYRYFQRSCCISLPRVLYGAVESTDEDVAHGVPSIFVMNTKLFDTLRWRYRTTAPLGMSDGRKYLSYNENCGISHSA
jgi:hypothetical protein